MKLPTANVRTKSFPLIIILVMIGAMACQKTKFSSNPDLFLYNSTFGDTLSFDTVFTSVKNITRSFKIFNPNKQSIHINDLKLYGGANSDFKINVNGLPGSLFQNIDLLAGDSMYVFVTVQLNQNSKLQPFFINDSIGYRYNGKEQKVRLVAYGQSAYFFTDKTIQNDTIWNSRLPIVLSGNTTIAANAKLTINKGTRIYCHSKSKIIVDGTLHINGGVDTSDRVVITNDRLDYPYSELAGSWGGIVLGENSKDNKFNFVTIKNAERAIVDTSNVHLLGQRAILNGCIVVNALNEALLLRNTNFTAYNSLLANSGTQLAIEKGGNYSFLYCTIVGYSNEMVAHSNPSLNISNADANDNTADLSAKFKNCIVYGNNESLSEIVATKVGNTPFDVDFENVLYKANEPIANATFSNSIQNQDPQFASIDNFRMLYDFRLNEGSPAIGAAQPTTLLTDLLGNARDLLHPTNGCYEFVK